MRQHPETPLPRSVHQICALTGCTEDQVKTFLYRRRRDVKRILASLPDLKGRELELETTEGDVINMKWATGYAYIVDHWSAKVQIRVETEVGTFMVKIPNIVNFAGNVQLSR